MHSSIALALAASFSAALAAQQGFNYASSTSTDAAKTQTDFETDFQAAHDLAGTNSGFTDARLYTMIQHGTKQDVISAIPAALNVDGTHLLFGIWASGGQDGLDNEIAALKLAIQTYGTKLAGITNGISVGSEDLYRISPTGVINKSGVGANPATVVDYIKKVKEALAGTALSEVPVGHVDTWTAWVNETNSPVVEASDFIGMDAYPYFQSTFNNPIEQAKSLFLQAFQATKDNSQGKPVWITETGWPVSGKTENAAIPSTTNAKTYWDQVGCPLFGNTPVYWYTLKDADPTTPNPSFGVITSQSNTPLYDLSCSNTTSSSSSSSSSSASATAVSSGISLIKATATGTGVFATGTGISTASSGNSTSGFRNGSGSGSASSSSGSGSSGSDSGSGAAGSTGSGSTGKSGPSPTGTQAPFSNGAVANGGSVLCALGALMAVAAFVL